MNGDQYGKKSQEFVELELCKAGTGSRSQGTAERTRSFPPTLDGLMAPPCTCRPSDVSALKSSRILASLQKWSMGGYFLECCNSREAFERERGEEICVTEGNLSVHSTFEETRGVNVKRVFFFFFFFFAESNNLIHYAPVAITAK